MDALNIDRTIPQRSDPFMGVRAPVSHGTAAERLALAVNRHVGRDRAFSIEQFRRKIGASASAVEKMKAGEYTPGLALLLTIKRELPPAFANDLLELAGLTGARRLCGESQAAASVLAELTERAAQIARDLVNPRSPGFLDHVEKAELRKTLPPLVAMLQEFVAQLGAD